MVVRHCLQHELLFHTGGPCFHPAKAQCKHWGGRMCKDVAFWQVQREETPCLQADSMTRMNRDMVRQNDTRGDAPNATGQLELFNTCLRSKCSHLTHCSSKITLVH
eukprot:1241819-Amphidinium_carterae.1